MNNPTVAVVILNWNGRDFLRKFLPSVLASSYIATRVIVADNGSTDDSIDVLEREFPEVEIIRNEENYGFAEGYNRALAEVDAPIYVLLNSDVEVKPNWLQALVQRLQEDPKIAAVQPKILAEHDRGLFEYAGAAGGFIDRLGFPYCRGRIFDECERDEGQYDAPIDIFWASGAAMCIRSEVYHAAGGLDGDFFAHMEEIDLCWRIKDLGYRIVYTPDSVVYHVGGGTLNKSNPRKTYLNFRNNLSMLSKNYAPAELFTLLPLRILLDAIAAYRALFSGDTDTFKAIARAHFSFIGNFPHLLRKRSQVKRLKQEKQIGMADAAGRFKGSIVWNYFVKGRRRFSEL